MKATIQYNPGYASGGRKNWAKVVRSVVDGTQGGYAFEGDFLKEGENEVEVGATVIMLEHTGSAKNGEKMVEVFRVASDPPELIPADGRPYNLRTELVSLKAKVREVMAGPAPADNPLASFSDEALLAEIARRGKLGELSAQLTAIAEDRASYDEASDRAQAAGLDS